MIFAQKPAFGNGRTRSRGLAVLVKSAGGVSMEGALAKADKAGLVIASNKHLDEAFYGSGEWPDIRDHFDCWTGTMAAYDKPDQKLGKTIEFTALETGVRYVFPVPEEHIGKKNVVLVAEHPNFCLVKDGKDRLVQATEVDIVERFPTQESGWFFCDTKCAVPHGNMVRVSNPDARYLWRIDKRVGLVARFCGEYSLANVMRFVDLGSALSIPLGVAVEAPIANAASDAPLRMREENGTLIVEGPPEQIAAAARLIGQMKAK